MRALKLLRIVTSHPVHARTYASYCMLNFVAHTPSLLWCLETKWLRKKLSKCLMPFANCIAMNMIEKSAYTHTHTHTLEPISYLIWDTQTVAIPAAIDQSKLHVLVFSSS